MFCSKCFPSGDRLKVGFIGLGNMGLPMAERLMEVGYELVVYNRTRERVKGLEERGAEVADTPRELGSKVDLIVEMVSDAEAVRNTLLGPEGALEGVRTGTLIIEMSTLYPDFVIELAEYASRRGAEFIDAPVLGSVPQAREGKLSIMVGGAESVYRRAKALLDALGKSRLVGPVGHGTMFKLVINSMLIGMVAVMSEGLAFARALGLDPGDLLETMGEHAVGDVARYYWARILNESFPTRFALRLASKDMKYALLTAHKVRRELPVLSAAHQQYVRAERLGLGDADYTRLFKALTEV
ncbi:MAG TPA: NAD(P)-dependent oxidoreductase [Candidatus Korarchaeota archaeon]|nr:NAD(P)-dependent oxidoreductase [Candidatus Korarchaeota archaeon]